MVETDAWVTVSSVVFLAYKYLSSCPSCTPQNELYCCQSLNWYHTIVFIIWELIQPIILTDAPLPTYVLIINPHFLSNLIPSFVRLSRSSFSRSAFSYHRTCTSIKIWVLKFILMFIAKCWFKGFVEPNEIVNHTQHHRKLGLDVETKPNR